jgi:hypothetical protein
MSTLSDSGFPNLVNIAKRMDPQGGIAEVTNILSKKLNILDDIPWVEGNLPTGHRITLAANGLPSASWRKLNAGVAATKGDTEQFDETCGMLEDESKMDVAAAELNGNGAAYRASEDKLKLEGFAQQFATALFYESAASNPERIQGLTPRYPATSGYDSSSYTLAGTNAGTNAHSVWLITWEPRKIYGIYPKGSMAGLQRIDKGIQRVLDGSSNAFYAYCTWFSWKCGIAVEDYRYAVRFQFDPDDSNFDDTDRGLYIAMQKMLGTIYENTPQTRFYMDRTSKLKLDAQLMSNDHNVLTYLDSGGERIPTFMGVPIRVTDSLVAETAIS